MVGDFGVWICGDGFVVEDVGGFEVVVFVEVEIVDFYFVFGEFVFYVCEVFFGVGDVVVVWVEDYEIFEVGDCLVCGFLIVVWVVNEVGVGLGEF